MIGDGDDRGGKHETARQRRDRLASELRQNISKRKALARARARPEGPDEKGADEPQSSIPDPQAKPV